MEFDSEDYDDKLSFIINSPEKFKKEAVDGINKVLVLINDINGGKDYNKYILSQMNVLKPIDRRKPPLDKGTIGRKYWIEVNRFIKSYNNQLSKVQVVLKNIEDEKRKELIRKKMIEKFPKETLVDKQLVAETQLREKIKNYNQEIIKCLIKLSEIINNENLNKKNNLINIVDGIGNCSLKIGESINTHERFLDITIFTRRPMDSFAGLLYLLLKYKKSVCSYLGNISWDYENLNELLNEVSFIWEDYKLRAPPTFKTGLTKCVQQGKDFVIYPLLLISSEMMHANYLIFDIKTKEFIRFEPHGMSQPHFKAHKLDEALSKLLTGFKYDQLATMQYCPKGLQTLQESEIGFLKQAGFELLDFSKGYCLAWSVWLVDQRLNNPHKSTREVVESETDRLMIDKYGLSKSITELMREYVKNFIGIKKEIGWLPTDKDVDDVKKLKNFVRRKGL